MTSSNRLLNLFLSTQKAVKRAFLPGSIPNNGLDLIEATNRSCFSFFSCTCSRSSFFVNFFFFGFSSNLFRFLPLLNRTEHETPSVEIDFTCCNCIRHLSFASYASESFKNYNFEYFFLNCSFLWFPF